MLKKFLVYLSSLILVFSRILLPLPVYAAPGTFDLSFGTNGLVKTEFSADPAADDTAFALGVQTDGKIVAGGIAFIGADYDFALARYNSDGTLDSSFGTGGLVTTDVNGFTDEILALKIQTDGKIVAVGDASNGTSTDFGVVRYNTNGSLDSTFGTGGKVLTDFSGSDVPLALGIQTDGKVVVSGGDGNGNFALVRYNTNGTLDSTFGTGGKVTTDFGGFDTAFGLAIQTDGKIVAVGSGNSDFALTRYNTDGTLDSTFGTAGKTNTDFLSNDTAFSVVLQTDGKIVVSGDGAGNFTLVRYNIDGTLDSTFGTGGKATTEFINASSLAFGLVQQTDGKFIAGGTIFGLSFDFGIVRYNNNGTLDTDFGTGGKVTADFGGDEQGLAIALQGNGQVVVGGTITLPVTGKAVFAITRFNASALESIVTTVPAGGSATSDSEADGATAVDPVETTITSPTGGAITISEVTPAGNPPTGFTLLGQQINITALPATALNPLVIVFVIDSSVLAGKNINTIGIFKNGVKLEACTGAAGTASPDPCWSSKVLLPDGDGQFTILTSTASGWTFGFESSPTVEGLISDVNDLISQGVLNKGQGNSLLVKLKKTNLRPFINQVKSFIDEGVLTSSQGQPLVDDASEIISNF